MTAVQVAIADKTFANGVCALRDLAISTRKGQFTALLGPSGAGKSTLLNLIAGLDTDYNGKIELQGNGNHRLGFIFQEARLIPWLKVRENIELVITGIEQGKRDKASGRLPELLQRVGLLEFAEAYPHQLSIGMQRRVSLVRAFIIRPDLLLMDESFQSLDAPTANQLRNLLLELWSETGNSILFVTHDLNEAIMLADRILFLSPRPARVMLDYAVELQRPGLRVEKEVIDLRQALLQQHPQLLSGIISAP